eukprot:6213083-Pleurochrysis_carterae.AAC.2
MDPRSAEIGGSGEAARRLITSRSSVGDWFTCDGCVAGVLDSDSESLDFVAGGVAGASRSVSICSSPARFCARSLANWRMRRLARQRL